MLDEVARQAVLVANAPLSAIIFYLLAGATITLWIRHLVRSRHEHCYKVVAHSESNGQKLTIVHRCDCGHTYRIEH